ncbi:MAG TPA: polymer-forming cytoskeletal protein [Pyrinomonadaceae bacterium]
MTTQAVTSSDERGQPRLVNGNRTNVNKDNWLGFVGDIINFTGEVCFKSMLRIDGHFSGNVTSSDGTLIISTGAEVTKAVIKVAVAKINGTVEGDILASKELVLGRTANVRGHLAAPALVVEEGAQLNGSCRRISAEAADLNIPQKANSSRAVRGNRP